MADKNKSFVNLMKAIPKIATMEQTQGLLKSIVTQWGTKNALTDHLTHHQEDGVGGDSKRGAQLPPG